MDKIEAENYQNSFDTDAVNHGETRFTNGVDVEVTGDVDGAYNVGWTVAGEWLEYDLTFADSANYRLDARVASLRDAGELQFSLNGAPLTTIDVSNTGGWQNWRTLSVNSVYMAAGTHTLRVTWIGNANINLNWFQFTPNNESDEITVAIKDNRVVEGESYGLRIELSQPSSQIVTLGVYTVPGTAEGGSDFYSLYRPLEILPGETQAFVPIIILDDEEPEPEEYFTSHLVNASVKIAQPITTHTIADNDEPTPAGRPGTEADNLILIKNTPYRNANHDNSPYATVKSTDLPIDDFLVDWQAYQQVGTITRPIANAANFRVYCEFSHFAYDDPILKPNKPGATHLHMFFGNTDANAFSTGPSLLNSGSSTCNGQELNRSAYWIPAVIDQNGNLPIPDDMLIYYKAYGPAIGRTEIYPDNMQLVSGNAMAREEQPGMRSFREYYFQCHEPGTNGDAGRKSNNFLKCNSNERLEISVKFQTCWNGEDPADYRNNAAFSNVWPTSGECPASHPRLLPQLQYRIFFSDHQGSENWILSSDVNMQDQSTIHSNGFSLHGDWFGGWNKQINQRWVDNCLHVENTDCDEGLLADPRRNSSAKGLRIRPDYSGPTRIPGTDILSQLCTTGKTMTDRASVALCDPY